MGKGFLRISEAAHLRRLPADMLLVTIRDLKDRRFTLECAVFLTSKEFQYYAELVNMPFADPLKALRVLGVVQARELLSQIGNMRAGEVWTPEQVWTMKNKVAPVLRGIIRSNKKAKQADLRKPAVYTRPRGRAALQRVEDFRNLEQVLAGFRDTDRAW